MMRVDFVDTDTGRAAHTVIEPSELSRISGVQLAAAMFPNPSADEVKAINGFLRHYRAGVR